MLGSVSGHSSESRFASSAAAVAAKPIDNHEHSVCLEMSLLHQAECFALLCAHQLGCGHLWNYGNMVDFIPLPRLPDALLGLQATAAAAGPIRSIARPAMNRMILPLFICLPVASCSIGGTVSDSGSLPSKRVAALREATIMGSEQSGLRFTSVMIVGGMIYLTWTGATNPVQLQSLAELQIDCIPCWDDIVTLTTETNALVPMASPTQFFRLSE
jgi:hypothetical protein